MCGEQHVVMCEVMICGGSPPRVRGTDRRRCRWGRKQGITPACAGNSGSLSRYSTTAKDHPRVCGEQLSVVRFRAHSVGSPPRVRGTVSAFILRPPSAGITPACAGNSAPRGGSGGGSWDHPRVCGEQQIPGSAGARCPGSPPRVRGTARGSPPEGPEHGITPACAGNSQCRLLPATGC